MLKQTVSARNRADVVTPDSREAAPLHTHAVVFEMLRQTVAQGDVLDLPCGSGAFTRRLLEAEYHVVAGDLEHHPALPDVEYRHTDMDRPLPFPSASFDAIVCIEGIEHLRRPFDFVQECRLVLRPGGRLFITTPNISSLRSRWRWFLTGCHNKCKTPLDERAHSPRHHVNMLSFPELRYMLHTNGFRIDALATNRIKPINWAYLPWVPVQYLAIRAAFARGAKDAAHGAQLREIQRQMMSLPLLLGESMIVSAVAGG